MLINLQPILFTDSSNKLPSCKELLFWLFIHTVSRISKPLTLFLEILIT